jgi:hypothetical protein
MDDAVAEISFESWKEFKSDFLDRIKHVQVSAWREAESNWEDKQLFFRGQSCSKWPLVSSFDRWMQKQPGWGDRDDRIEPYYWELLSQFVINGQEMGLLGEEFADLPRAAKELEQFELENSKNAILLAKLQAFGQHRGLATRLLDWSYSPYIAAFFAFSSWRSCASGEVAIWCIDVAETSRLFKDQDIRLIDGFGHADQRQLWQRGVFSRNYSNMLEADKIFHADNNRFRAAVRFPAQGSGLIL